MQLSHSEKIRKQGNPRERHMTNQLPDRFICNPIHEKDSLRVQLLEQVVGEPLQMRAEVVVSDEELLRAYVDHENIYDYLHKRMEPLFQKIDQIVKSDA